MMINEINEIAKSLNVVDLPELLQKECWEYKSEGRANIVVSYCGKNAKYNGIVLRVRKITLENYKNQNTKFKFTSFIHSKTENQINFKLNENRNEENNPNVIVEYIDNDNNNLYNTSDKLQINNLLYNNMIVDNFLGQQYSGMNILLKLNPTFLENLNNYIYLIRPENRRNIDRIDNEQVFGTLLLDYTKVNQAKIINSNLLTPLNVKDLTYSPSDESLSPNEINNIQQHQQLLKRQQFSAESISKSTQEISSNDNILPSDIQTIAIELKPKWGFKPNPKTSDFSKPNSFIKYKYCRFCLHYLLKNKKKIENSPPLKINDIHPILNNHFCPLDLYSNNKERIHRAMKCLYNCPGNNLKLFIDGKLSNLKLLNNPKFEKDQKDFGDNNFHNESKDYQSSSERNINDTEVLKDNLSEFFYCKKEEINSAFCNFFTNLILQESELFERLQFHQRHLDNLDIEKIIQFYDSLIKKNYNIDENSSNNEKSMKEPEIKDWIAGFKKYKEKIKELPVAVKYTNFTSPELIFDKKIDCQEIPKKKNEDYSDEEKMQYVIEFLMSKTLKDCSIIIAVQSLGNNNTEVDDPKNKNTTREITFNNKRYQYCVNVVDLDSKSIKKIPDYYKLDQDIVECYHNYKNSYGDCRENECIDTFDKL